MKGEKMSKTAQDVMTKNVIAVEENMMINNLIELFQEHKISGAPVVNNKKKLIGIVTRTDILSSYIDAYIDLNVKFGLKDILGDTQEDSSTEILFDEDVKVKNIMILNPVTVREDTPIKEMAEIMIDNNIHRLIIMRNSIIAGIVSTIDMLYYVAGRNRDE